MSLATAKICGASCLEAIELASRSRIGKPLLIRRKNTTWRLSVLPSAALLGSVRTGGCAAAADGAAVWLLADDAPSSWPTGALVFAARSDPLASAAATAGVAAAISPADAAVKTWPWLTILKARSSSASNAMGFSPSARSATAFSHNTLMASSERSNKSTVILSKAAVPSRTMPSRSSQRWATDSSAPNSMTRLRPLSE